MVVQTLERTKILEDVENFVCSQNSTILDNRKWFHDDTLDVYLRKGCYVFHIDDSACMCSVLAIANITVAQADRRTGVFKQLLRTLRDGILLANKLELSFQYDAIYVENICNEDLAAYLTKIGFSVQKTQSNLDIKSMYLLVKDFGRIV